MLVTEDTTMLADIRPAFFSGLTQALSVYCSDMLRSVMARQDCILVSVRFTMVPHSCYGMLHWSFEFFVPLSVGLSLCL